MFLVFALIATLPLMALSYLALGEARGALQEEVGEANRDTAQAAAGFVDVYVENGRVLLDTEARSPALLAAAAASNEDALQRQVTNLQVRSTYEGEPLFRSVTYLNATGHVAAGHPPEATELGANQSSSIVFIAAYQIGEPRVFPMAPEERALPIATPIFVEGEFHGVLVAHLGLDVLGARLRAFAPGAGQEMFLVDAAGRLVTHTNESVSAAAAAATGGWGSLPPALEARAGRSGFTEYEDPLTGETWLGAYAPMDRFGWAVVSAVPTSIAYEGLARLTAVLIVLSGILIGTILLASVIVARRIVQPVEELTAAASALAAGRLNTRIAPRGDDEIGELGHAFNEMANRIGESLDGIRRSEARYRSLVESANDLIFSIQPDGTFSFVGSLVEPMLGRPPSTLMGHPAHAFVHEGDRLAFLETVRRVLDHGEPVLWVPCRLLAADGSSRSVLVNFSPVFEQGDRPARVLGVAHDVTAERRQELIRDKAFQMARLVSEQSALEPMLDRGLALLLAVGSLERGAVFVGEGGALQEVAAANMDALPRARRADFANLAQRAAAETTPAHERSDESRGELLALPLVETGEALGAIVLEGAPSGLSGENLDVLTALTSQLAVGVRRTLFERRLKAYAAELETRVRERTTELTEKSREMESFLYSVSHDLKAPLISIQGYAETLDEEYGSLLKGDGAMYVERIRKNASLMESLIIDLLELSRIGRVSADLELVDMNDLCSELSARVGDRFRQAGGELRVAADLPPVRGERKRLAQLFNNLVDNAYKYRHPERPPIVEITAERGEIDVTYSVKDNGRGIPASAHAKLFEIFQRVHTPGMDDPGGTGMGLAIVKRIVETYRGIITLESREGEGTTFHISFLS